MVMLVIWTTSGIELTRLISEKIGRMELVKRSAHIWFWRS